MSRILFLLMATCSAVSIAGEPWALHTVDNASRGADGVRLADVDKDGRLDIVTGWEEGGKIRICFQPEPSAVRKPWPSIQVGNVKSPEDAVFADVNGDGWLDVVSSCEGKQQAVFFHLNPAVANGAASGERVRKSAAWTTKPVPASVDYTRWMFCEPLDSRTLIFGSKEPNATITLWDLSAADDEVEFLDLRKSGWIMSLRRFDVDNDGDDDIVYSDRKGPFRSIGWLENQSDSQHRAWQDHLIGGKDLEVMFLDITEVDDRLTIACNTRNGYALLLTPGTDVTQPWNATRIAHPDGVGGGKGIALGDVNLDGHTDLACTCEHAEGKVGVYWLSGGSLSVTKDDEPQRWTFNDISGRTTGIKFDRIELLDLDQDGDLDLLTCEERDNLGVIWYENPAN
ncbi:MAG: VCBS repeat-containing protein [Fuerstiella sp.]|nr:VCBS repeat-containing protein [Fuerstiella sp.]